MMSDDIYCECGAVVQRRSYQKHTQSLKHRKHVESQKTPVSLPDLDIPPFWEHLWYQFTPVEYLPLH